MTQFRHKVVWSLVMSLIPFTVGATGPIYADEVAATEAKVVALKKAEAATSIDKVEGKADCQQGCEKGANKTLSSQPRGGSILDLIFARNKAGSKAVDAKIADNQAAGNEPVAEDEPTLTATHQQVALLKVSRDGSTVADQPASPPARGGWGVKSFCLDREDNLLVAVGDAKTGQLLLLDPQGQRKQSWELTVVPEAVNVDPDGHFLVAGEGKIMKLGSDGEILQEVESPLIAELNNNKAALRQQVIEQLKARARSMAQQRNRYQLRIDNIVKGAAGRLDRDERAEYSLLQQRLKKYAEMDTSKLSAAEQNAWALRKVLFRMLETKVEQKLSEREIAQRDLYRKQMERYDKMALTQGSAEPTEERIEASMKSMLAYKSKVASISAAGGEIFIATGAVQGYGYDVYRFDENLANPEKIVTQLRGCCGQMDVQAGEAGLFVAENSRHQVRHFDRVGKKVNQWGSRARSGVRGFGGCCNPMNVAFGPDGTVYTAESSSGRIKRFSAAGELMELIGSVELVPGCKKVSIAVTKDHQRVYMLDITRNHIIVMEAKPETDQVVSRAAQENAS